MARRPPFVALLVLALPAAVHATEVWPNRTFTFTKAAFADPTLEANQDRITPMVWITRASSAGIYNIAQESFHDQLVSPMDTEWATGEALDYASLTFLPWRTWAGNNPPATVGVNAVVHLISEDIYIDIVFTSWGSGLGGGGGFSYRRGVPPVVPIRHGGWGRIKRLYR
jgi:hypothetical protein